MIGACAILAIAPLFDIELELSPWLPLLGFMTALSLAGIGLVIGNWAPSLDAANAAANGAGILLVLISPIYFPASRLPDWLEPFAHVSPYTHAANALDAALSNSGSPANDLAILVGITIIGLVIGVAGMRWREN